MDGPDVDAVAMHVNAQDLATDSDTVTHGECLVALALPSADSATTCLPPDPGT